MMRADLNLNDFLTINKQVRKIGGIQKLVSALPGGDKALKDGSVNENALDEMEVMINSMTREEREQPSIINGSRRARIAAGAGVSVTQLNQMLKKYNETRKMMKQVMAKQDLDMGSRKGRRNASIARSLAWEVWAWGT